MLFYFILYVFTQQPISSLRDIQTFEKHYPTGSVGSAN